MSWSTGKRKGCPLDAQLGDQSKDNSILYGAQNPGLSCDPVDGDNNPYPKKRGRGFISPPPLPPLATCQWYLGVPTGVGRNRVKISSFSAIPTVNCMVAGPRYVHYLESRLRKPNNEAGVHNFAVPGATAVDGLSEQPLHFFTVFPKKNSPIIFLGINDCGSAYPDELEFIVEIILDAVDDLYIKAGTRNFVLVNVPPIYRLLLAVNSESSDEIEDRVTTWNDLLQGHTMDSGASTKKATVFLFSSHQVLTEILEDPSEFDFGEDDPMTEGGGIWEDGLHLTTDVHDILAVRLFTSLFSTSHANET